MKTLFIFLAIFCTDIALFAQSKPNLADMLNKARADHQLKKTYPKIKELAEASKSDGDSIYARNMCVLARATAFMGRFEEAENMYMSVLQMYTKLFGKESANYAVLLSELGVFYQSSGKHDKVEDLHKEVLAIAKKIYGQKTPEYAVALNNLGAYYRKVEQYEQAIPLLQQAIEIYKEIQIFDENYPLPFSNISGVYRGLNQPEEALRYTLLDIEARAKAYGTEHPKYKTVLLRAANDYMSLEKYKEAEQYFIKALGKDGLKNSNASNLATFYAKIGEYAKSEKIFNNILSQHSKEKLNFNPIFEVHLFKDIAHLYTKMKQFDKAENFFLRSLSVNARLKDSLDNSIDAAWQQKLLSADFISISAILETLDSYVNLLLENPNADNKNKAYSICQTVLKIGKNLKNGFETETDKLRILSKLNTWINKAINLAFDLSKEQPQQLSLIFEYAEQNKANILLDATKAQQARAISDLPDSLALKEIELQKELSELKKGLLETEAIDKKNAIQQNIYELDIEVSNFKKQLEQQYPKYFNIKYQQKNTQVADIQNILDEKTALLEYFLGKENLYLLCITKKTVEVFDLGINRDSLKKIIFSMRNSLSNYAFINENPDEAYHSYINIAYNCYELLVEKALKNKELAQLIIIPDGELGHIPFETFLTEKLGNTLLAYNELPYLLNKYKVSYIYSATLWKENLETNIKNNNGNFFAAAASYDEALIQNINVRSNTGKEIRSLRASLENLPAAKAEVMELAKHFNGLFLFDQEANEKTFKEKAGEYALIHLAMHGLSNNKQPILSSLAFTENGDTLEDNFLEAWEIAHLQLNADLVVLSACETGYGKFQQGEGIMSLARSFMYAGTPALLVSLWEVNDASTSILMPSFYQNLATGMDKAEALRQAKLAYIKTAKGVSAHPAFWSPFVQMGDTRAIAIPSKGLAWWWWAGGGLLFFVVIGIIVRLKRGR